MTEEMINKARACKTAEELLALAKENGFDLTAEEAAAKYAELHAEGEICDDELDSVAGGACSNDPELSEGITIRWSSTKAKHKDTCSRPDLFTVESINRHDSRYGPSVGVDVSCTECGAWSYGIKPSQLYNV